MDLEANTRQMAEVMKRTKADWVASGPEHTDIAIYLHFWRGDDMVATVVCRLDRDVALQAALIAASGFCADVMMMTVESYHSAIGDSPITGMPWRAGEMQFVAQNYPEAFEKGWVDECLMSISLDRFHNWFQLYMPYVIKDGQVEWKEQETFVVGEGEASGHVVEYLEYVMDQDTIMEKLTQSGETNEFIGMIKKLVNDPEIQHYHTDMATYHALFDRNLCECVIFVAKPDSLRQQLIKERLGEDALFVEPREE